MRPSGFIGESAMYDSPLEAWDSQDNYADYSLAVGVSALYLDINYGIIHLAWFN